MGIRLHWCRPAIEPVRLRVTTRFRRARDAGRRRAELPAAGVVLSGWPPGLQCGGRQAGEHGGEEVVQPVPGQAAEQRLVPRQQVRRRDVLACCDGEGTWRGAELNHGSMAG